jgi:hypothetical protein
MSDEHTVEVEDALLQAARRVFKVVLTTVKAHGGGRRCIEEGCTKSAEGTTELCAAHGGGRRCATEGCTKSAQGPTDSCTAHGGGQRCGDACCTLDASIARGRHPDTGMHMCTQSMRYTVRKAYEDGDAAKGASLMKHFGFKKDLVLRAEHAWFHRINVVIPALRRVTRIYDTSLAKTVGQQKSVKDPRADVFSLFDNGTVRLGLHDEFDENPDHEDSTARETAIADMSGCGPDNVYILPVCGHIYNRSRALCIKYVVNKHHTYYKVSEEGERVIQEQIVGLVNERLEWIIYVHHPFY